MKDPYAFPCCTWCPHNIGRRMTCLHRRCRRVRPDRTDSPSSTRRDPTTSLTIFDYFSLARSDVSESSARAKEESKSAEYGLKTSVCSFSSISQVLLFFSGNVRRAQGIRQRDVRIKMYLWYCLKKDYLCRTVKYSRLKWNGVFILCTRVTMGSYCM